MKKEVIYLNNMPRARNIPRLKNKPIIRQKKENSTKPDKILAITCFALIATGILILSSVSGTLSYEKIGNSYYFFVHQIVYGIIPGLLLGLFCYKQKLNWFKNSSLFFLFGAIFLTGLIFIPGIGLELGGAKRWIAIGGFSMQPAEFLKIAFFVYLASWLAKKAPLQEYATPTSRKKRINTSNNSTLSNFIPFLIILAIISILLLQQRNLSTLGLILGVGIIMYFMANTFFWHTPFIVIGMGIAVWVFIINTPYRLNRLLTFLNYDEDPLGKGYQIQQSLIAIGSGGIFGLGLGMSRQKFGFLPESIADTIFPVFAEETGFAGAIFLILLFITLMWRGIKIAKDAKDSFSSLLAIGITSWIFLQAMINIGAMTNLLPLTGIPLPFISYGGSHIVAELIAMGLLLNISKK